MVRFPNVHSIFAILQALYTRLVVFICISCSSFVIVIVNEVAFVVVIVIVILTVL